jgi:hypothetical protein
MKFAQISCVAGVEKTHGLCYNISVKVSFLSFGKGA